MSYLKENGITNGLTLYQARSKNLVILIKQSWL